MKSIRVSIIAVLCALVASFAALSGHVAAQDGNAPGGKLRFLHALPGGPAVDVFVDNVLVARNLEFSSATRYLNMPAGDRQVIVTRTGNTTTPTGAAVVSAKVKVSIDQPNQLIVVQGTPSKPEASVYSQDLNAPKPGFTRLTAIHAVKDAPPVDVVRGDGTPIIQGLEYGKPYGEFDLAAINASLAVVPAGGDLSGAVIAAQAIPLDAATHNTIVVAGTLEGSVKPTYIRLTAPVVSANPTDVLVRFVNASAADKALDIYVNDRLISTGLGASTFSEHLPLTTGTAKLDIRSAGDAATVPPLATQSLTLNAATAKAQTVIVSGETTSLKIVVVNNDAATLAPSKARINLINLLDDALTLNVGGSAVVKDVTAAKMTKATEVNAGLFTFEVNGLSKSVKGRLTLNGGTISDMIVSGSAADPKFVLATTGLNESLGSAPTNVTPLESAAPTLPAAAPTDAVAVVVAPTPAPVVTQAPVAVAQEPTVAPLVVVNTPTLRPTVIRGIFATVITNEGVNLKIREYPRTDAKTLGLIPSGDQVKVVGVKGPNSRTATPAGFQTKASTPTIVATARADIWVFIEWQNTDGDKISGWTIAQYLDFVVNGKTIRRDNITDVLSFPQVPDDQFGTIEGSGLTPVAPDDKRTVGTVITQVGVNAQLRRQPSVKSESLALLPSGSTVFVQSKTSVPPKGEIGEPKSATWFFVQFDAEGASVFGWMSADNLTLAIAYNKKPVDEKDVPVAASITPGFIQGNATQVVAPGGAGILGTVILLDVGANLKLRRDPNINAEVLQDITLNSELQILGRNGAGTWLQVRFNGVSGWVSAQYVRVTRNGRTYNIKELKIVNGERDTFGTTTPTATPRS
jgi:uncharacterized protein YraI